MTQTKRRGRPRHDDILTPAEWRTVHAVQHGMTNAQIASRRGISRDAVKFHLANILGKLGLDRRAELRGLVLVPNASGLRRQETMKSAISIDRIGQVSRSVSDIQASTAWYRDVLGLPHLYSFGDMAFFDCGGLRLYLQQKAEPAEESVLYFQVADIVAAHAELAGRGVAFASPPHMIHRHENGVEEWMAFFHDPDGRLLALIAQTQGTTGNAGS